MENRLAVCATPKLRGVSAPGYQGKTYDWRKTRGGEENSAKVGEYLRVVSLREALDSTYRTDAHCVAYMVAGDSKQPRINKGGLEFVRSIVGAEKVVCSVSFADVDNPGHAVWTPELYDGMADVLTIPELQTTGIYFTRAGYRVVQPWTREMSPEEFEAVTQVWVESLETAGIPVDRACLDWTRMFRLPGARRGGDWEPRKPLLSSMQAIEPPLVTVAIKCPSNARQMSVVKYESEVPERWLKLASECAEVLRRHEKKHPIFLDLSGALIRRGVETKSLPALLGLISSLCETPDRRSDRERCAEATVERYLSGKTTGGLTRLSGWDSELADVVGRWTAKGREAELRRSENVTVPPTEQSYQDLKAKLRSLPDGVSVISAECGLGKTKAAIEVAVERASKQQVSTRVPLQSKTGLSVPTHELARQVVYDLKLAGVPAKRLFGPLSVLDGDGKPECKIYDQARALQAGGQSVRWELCQGRGKNPCQYRNTCSAKDGVEGPDDARVFVGPHAMVSELVREIGNTGLLVIDEPGSIAKSVKFSVDKLQEVWSALGYFGSRFAYGITPALRCLSKFAETEGVKTWQEIVNENQLYVSEGELRDASRETGCLELEVLAQGRECRPEDATGGPPIKTLEISRARADKHHAEKLGQASSVLSALYLSCQTPSIIWRVWTQADTRYCGAILPNQGYRDALTRIGSTVVMDAGARVKLPEIKLATGYEPAVHTYRATGSAEISRTLIRHSGISKSRSWSNGQPLAKLVFPALRKVMERVKDLETVALITWLPLRAILEGKTVDSEWEAKLRTLPRPKNLLYGHYGAVRGLNAYKDCDAIVTFGDPIPNLLDIETLCRSLCISDSSRYCQDLASAELEQAQERARSVRRTKPLQAYHVGSIRPWGTGWGSGTVRVENGEGGRPGGVTVDLGKLREYTLRFGPPAGSSQVWDRYLRGYRQLPEEIYEQIKEYL